MADVSRVRAGSIPLGLHALTTAYATTATHTTLQNEGLTLTVAYRANRILRMTWNGSFFAPAGSQRVTIRFLRGSTTVYDYISPTAIGTIVNEGFTISVPFLGPATASSETFKIQIAALSSNTAVQSFASASAPRTLLLEDLGPQ